MMSNIPNPIKSSHVLVIGGTYGPRHVSNLPRNGDRLKDVYAAAVAVRHPCKPNVVSIKVRKGRRVLGEDKPRPQPFSLFREQRTRRLWPWT